MEFDDLTARISLEGDLTCRLRLESPSVAQEPLDLAWDGREFASWISKLDRRTLSSDALAGYAANVLGSKIVPTAEWFGKAFAGDRRNIRILLQVGSAAFYDLPWEGLGSLARQTGVGPVTVVRIPLWRSTLAELPVSLPLRVLGISPNPKIRYSMDVHRELELVKPLLPDVIWRPLEEPQTPEALRKFADDFQPHVLHFIGHGGCDGEGGSLVMANAAGEPDWVTARQLTEMLPPSVRLLCLSSPTTTRNYDLRAFGRLASDSSASRMPSVIFSSTAIDSNEGIKLFWEAVYNDIVNSGSVMEAYAAGEKAFHCAPDISSFPGFGLALRETGDVQFVFSKDRAFETDSADSPAALAVQLASRLANDIALQAANCGTAVPEILMRHAAAQREVAAKLQKNPVPFRGIGTSFPQIEAR